jgi:hypothetical protein
MSYVSEWKAATLMLESHDNHRLPPGKGPVATIWMSQPSPKELEESPVDLWEYNNYSVDFYTYAGKYSPVLGYYVHTGCCVARVGDVNQSGVDEPTIGDVTMMIDALFILNDKSIFGCLPEADINQSGGINPLPEDITIGDVSVLIDYLFVTGPSRGLAECLEGALSSPKDEAVPTWIQRVLAMNLEGLDTPEAVLEEYIRRINE